MFLVVVSVLLFFGCFVSSTEGALGLSVLATTEFYGARVFARSFEAPSEIDSSGSGSGSSSGAIPLKTEAVVSVQFRENVSTFGEAARGLKDSLLVVSHSFYVNNTEDSKSVNTTFLNNTLTRLLAYLNPAKTLFSLPVEIQGSKVYETSYELPICYPNGPQPCLWGDTNYVFEEVAFFPSNASSVALSQQTFILPLPKFSPLNLAAVNNSTTSVEVQWEPPSLLVDQSNTLVSYRVTVSYGTIGVSSSPVDPSLPLATLQGLFPNVVRSVVVDASSTSFVLSGALCAVTSDPVGDRLMVNSSCLYPATTFLFVVEAVGTKYRSSSYLIASTREGRQMFPVEGVTVYYGVAFFPDRILLQFPQIPILTGVIRAFNLEVTDTISKKVVLNFNYLVGVHILYTSYPANLWLASIRNLLPNTVYDIKLTPLTSSGSGAISQVFSIPTTQDASSIITDLQVDSIVDSPFHFALNFSSPARPSSPILFYTVYSCEHSVTFNSSTLIPSACTLEYKAPVPTSNYTVDQSALPPDQVRTIFVSQLIMKAGAGPITRALREPVLVAHSTPSSSSSSSWKTIVPAVLVPAIVVILVLLALVLYFRRHHKTVFRFPEVDARWEISRNRLRLSGRIGEGIEGIVYKAKLIGVGEGELQAVHVDEGVSSADAQIVAVKASKPNASHESLTSFIAEGTILKRCCAKPHPNIMQLIGVCMTQEPLYLVLEYAMFGSLKQFLIDRQPPINSLEVVPLTTQDMVRMCVDIASGMEWLVSCGIIHRDVAARNCLVFEDYRVKISDFGMCKDISFLEYYRKSGEMTVPVRWMAPEALIHGRFSHETDIFSMGVLFWEVFSYGATPFGGLSNSEVFDAVIKGERLGCPIDCPLPMYDIMHLCWGAGDVPNPAAIIRLLSQILEILNRGNKVELESSSSARDSSPALSRSLTNKTPPHRAFSLNSSNSYWSLRVGSADTIERPLITTVSNVPQKDSEA